MSAATKPGHHETSVEEARSLARVDAEGHVYAQSGLPPEQTPSGRTPPEQTPPERTAGEQASTEVTPAEGTSTEETPAEGASAHGAGYVGQYPEADADEALKYFSRKFDDLYNRALLLRARVATGADSAKSLGESHQALQEQLQASNWVGDVTALRNVLQETAQGVEELRKTEKAQAEVAVQAHLAVREEIVAEAEQLAAVPAEQQHWKAAQQRMAELFDRWKAEQRKPPRLAKSQEDPYWKRFRAARNEFDKHRRVFFAQRDKDHAEVKRAKEELIAEAERLQTSTDFGPTTKAYHRLMDQWKALGRGAKKADDAQWGRFRAAQDVFFAAREQANAAMDAEFAENLVRKEAILEQLRTLMPFKAPDAVRERYFSLLEQWDAAGKVPRDDVRRIEAELSAVQDAFREAEGVQRGSADSETSARQRSMLEQLDQTIAELEADLSAAEAAGDARRAKDVSEALEARRSWREMLA
jgi:hypothetical protein